MTFNLPGKPYLALSGTIRNLVFGRICNSVLPEIQWNLISGYIRNLVKKVYPVHPYTILTGGPQGSVLDPLLIVFFISPTGNHHHHHLFLKRLFLPRSLAQLGSDVFPDMRSLHISLNTTHSGCKTSSSISSLTYSLQVFLPLPAHQPHLTPATTTFLQTDTQSSPLLRSACPNHLNLPRLTTSTCKL